MNTHTNKAMEIINNCKFQVKGVKTFTGREGYGINANLYYENKKVAFLLDSGNGGMLDIDWNWGSKDDKPYVPAIVKEAKLYLETLVNTLPKKSMWGEYDFDDEGIVNTLIDGYLAKQDFNKVLKKVSVVPSDNKIASYKAKASDLDKTYNFKEGVMTFREFVLKDKSVKLILNDMPTDKAFNTYMENR